VNQDVVIQLAMEALEVGLKVSMPFLLAGLVVGLVISVFQAVTQIQEQTLTFIPKIVGMGLVLVIAGPWMLSEVVTYTAQLYGSIPELVAGG
jgi:flagellar biosynthesis protein FliQ